MSTANLLRRVKKLEAGENPDYSKEWALPANPTVKWDDRHPGNGVSTRVFHDSGRYHKWERSSRRRFWGLKGK